MAATIVGVILSTLCIAQTRLEAQAQSHACQAKYRAELPAGAIAPKSDSIRLSLAQFEPVTAYACVVVTVDENGQLVDPRVVETDYAPFAEHLLQQVVGAKWQAAALEGRTFKSQAVVSASYGP